MTHLRHRMPFNPDPGIGSLPDKQPTARCHAVMHPYEAVWGALLDDVLCGRPAGHNGRHRSVQSLDKERLARRWERYTETKKQKRRRAKLARALREIDRYGRSGR